MNRVMIEGAKCVKYLTKLSLVLHGFWKKENKIGQMKTKMRKMPKTAKKRKRRKKNGRNTKRKKQQKNITNKKN